MTPRCVESWNVGTMRRGSATLRRVNRERLTERRVEIRCGVSVDNVCMMPPHRQPEVCIGDCFLNKWRAVAAQTARVMPHKVLSIPHVLYYIILAHTKGS